ncbi:hypothetical protein EKL97_15300 [Flavobacterium sp. LS1P28]|uniref:hypothetical protein n=1 Tax=Flavobacterium sp. LS1P28 TaxID=2497752 RepID=UPI000F82AF69|nr:hypothetical protein [Flavobacterium sp. LS1P28]RTY77478.1 hypothetical protein EKL97_15300 [Flavobacterium sp. LS1P28]
MEFVEKEILITEKESVLELFKTTVNQIKYISFLSAAYLDLLVSFSGIINAKTAWDEIYYSRNGFLAIYEAIKTYDNYQKSFRKLIISNYPHLNEEYNELNLELKKLKKEYYYDNKISILRNKAAGHYDKNYVIYYNQIQSIDVETSKKAIAGFANFLQSVIIFSDKIIDELQLSSKINADKAKAEWELAQNKK